MRECEEVLLSSLLDSPRMETILIFFLFLFLFLFLLSFFFLFFQDHKAVADDMFIKLDTQGAEKIILPSLLSWYSSFPFPHKPAMFISFHGVGGYEDKLDSMVRVIHLYKYYSIAGKDRRKKKKRQDGGGGEKRGVEEVKFHKASEFTKEMLVESEWMDLFLSDRSLDEYIHGSNNNKNNNNNNDNNET